MTKFPSNSLLFRGWFRGWIEAIGTALIAAGTVWFYSYLATSHSAEPWKLSQEATGYYHHLVDGFRSGQLSMKVTPDPGLATLANPYDPVERVRSGHPGWHDVTYHKERYYLYFGVAPALTLFLPFRVLTGLHFPEVLACAFFCAAGYGVSLLLFLALRRKYFPHTGRGLVWLGTLMLGLGNFCTLMLTRSQFYEVPISAAYFFSMLAAAMLFAPVTHPLGPRHGLWLASAALGLAVASRPHFVFASCGLGLVWLWRASARARNGQSGWGRAGLGDALALAVPLGLSLLGLFAYNYLRFDSIFEFGQKYQLAGSNQVGMKLLDWRSVPANLYYYFWAPAQIGRYFPFFEVISGYPGTLSKYYYGIENPYGLLTNMPCYWLAFAAPVLWLARYRHQRECGMLLLLWGAGFVSICGFTLFFVSATNRYMVDFLPSLLLLAVTGLLMMDGSGERLGRRRRFMLRGIVGLAVVYSAFFNVMAAFQHNGLFRSHRPLDFNRIASWCNYPVGLWEKFVGYKPGPVELTLTFPRDKLGATEPLVVTGTVIRSDFLYVSYTGNGKIQIGFTHLNDRNGVARVVTQPISVDYDQPHRLGIQMGMLYPPEGHLYFADWTPEAVREAKETLRVLVDGIPYLDVKQAFYDTTPGYTSFGENHVSAFGGRRFTGTLHEVRRAPLIAPLAPFTGGGFVRLAFRFPKGTSGGREPLIATGQPGTDDLLFVSYEDEAHIRLGFHHAASEPLLSEPIAIAPDDIQLLEVSFGSFYPAPGDEQERELANALIVKFNGQLIWAQEQAFHPAGNAAPRLGVYEGTSGEYAGQFSGQWVASQPVPSEASDEPYTFAPYWIIAGDEAAHGSLRLKVTLPDNQTGKFEPLLVTGSSAGQADYVWIQYHDATRVVIGYEHTGGGGPRAVATLDYSRPVDIEISVPSLFPPENDAFFSGRSVLSTAAVKNRAQIKVNGVILFDERVQAHPSTPAQTTPLESRVSTTFGTRFTGKTERVERLTQAMPAGFLDRDGPLEIELEWPQRAVGHSEVLLATGPEGSEDVLWVTWQEGMQATLSVKSADGRVIVGEPFQLEPGGRQQIRVAWGGFHLDETRLEQRNRVTVWIEDQVVLQGAWNFAFAQPQVVRIGRGNPSDPAFGGQLYGIRRVSAP